MSSDSDDDCEVCEVSEQIRHEIQDDGLQQKEQKRSLKCHNILYLVLYVKQQRGGINLTQSKVLRYDVVNRLI